MGLFDGGLSRFAASPEFQKFGSALKSIADKDTAYRDDQHMQRVFAANPAFAQQLYGAQNQMADNETNRMIALAKLKNMAAGGDLPAALQLTNAYEQASKGGDTERAKNILMFAKALDKGVYLNPQGQAQQVPGYGQTVGGIEAAKAGMEQDAKNTSNLNYAAPIATATAKGKVVGENEGANVKKSQQAPAIIDLLDRAEALLPEATNGTMARIGRDLAGAAGVATKGSEADSQLNVIAAGLVSNVPRMEGPQSDKDVQMYHQAAGDLANANLPVETRQAAIKTIRAIQEKYAQQSAGTQGGQGGGNVSKQAAIEELRLRGLIK